MSSVAVTRLSLRAPAGRMGEARQRCEDALRLAANDESRLLILKRLDLGIIPAGTSSARWAQRAAERLDERRQRAVHGAAPDAAHADAIWFTSVEEARSLLLLFLARGQTPTAWFWRLAVPDWRGLAPERCLAIWAAQAARSPEQRLAFARVLAKAVEGGHAARVLRWLAAVPSAFGPAEVVSSAAAERATHASASINASGARAVARSLIARLGLRIETDIRDLVCDEGPTQSPALRELVALMIVAAAPELAALIGEAERLADIWMAEIVAQDRRRPARWTETAIGTTQTLDAPSPAEPAREDEPAAAVLAGISPPPLATASMTDTRDQPDPTAEHFSRHAGILLVIRALWRMGIAEWLADRPELAAQGFARALLVHVAERMRCAPDDPLRTLLGPFDPAPDHLLTAWRVGLDRWLRRRAKVRLSDVVYRAGWLIRDGDRIAVRFPVGGAEIRLRRHALDLDPGWVDWLGLALVYHFRDEPLR